MSTLMVFCLLLLKGMQWLFIGLFVFHYVGVFRSVGDLKEFAEKHGTVPAALEKMFIAREAKALVMAVIAITMYVAHGVFSVL